jgi:cell division protein FtsN
MRAGWLSFGLLALLLCRPAWIDSARADPAADVEALEASAANHVAAYVALDGERSKLQEQFRAIVEELTKRLSFGTAPNNPVLQKSLQQAKDALASVDATTDALAAATADLTDDAAKANTLGRTLHAALAVPGADKAALQPLADQVTAASDKLDHSLAEALELRRKMPEQAKTDEATLDRLAKAVETGKLPESGTSDATMADMLAPPKLMDPGGAPPEPSHGTAETGHWAIEFGLFPSVDDAGYVMARLSQRGTTSHFVQVRDKLGHAAYKVVTRTYASRAEAEQAAAELRKHDLHPSGVVEAPAG